MSIPLIFHNMKPMKLGCRINLLLVYSPTVCAIVTNYEWDLSTVILLSQSLFIPVVLICSTFNVVSLVSKARMHPHNIAIRTLELNGKRQFNFPNLIPKLPSFVPVIFIKLRNIPLPNSGTFEAVLMGNGHNFPGPVSNHISNCPRTVTRRVSTRGCLIPKLVDSTWIFSRYLQTPCVPASLIWRSWTYMIPFFS